MRSRLLIVSAMFVVSGATGLLYQVAFAKVLATIFGATAYAISTVLSAFMAGLALGAYLGGRYAHKLRAPLAGYGVAEIGVGVICAATPWAFDGIAAAYVALIGSTQSMFAVTAVRATLTFIAIVIPTTCMGATLPLLARLVTADAGGEARLPRLYALNTLGGATGSLLSAYLILPLLGIRDTMRAAAVINVAIGILAIVLARSGAEDRRPRPDREPEKAEPHDETSLAKELYVFAFASGFLVFATEVVDTHLLTLLIGNSAYAFGLMLAVFLVCLGVGAARAPVFAAKHGAEQGLARGLGLTALTLVLTIPLWDQLPRFFAFAGKHVDSWAGRELCRAIAALVILVVPTLFMGTTFPLLLGRIAATRNVAKNVGRLTVANTAGTILGAVVTGYVILPLLGSQRSLIGVAILFAILAAVAARKPSVPGTRAARVTIGLAAAAVVAGVFMPRWNLARLTNGANVYFTHGPPPDDIVFVREDVHGGVTTVASRGDLLTLYTNGKFQGDNGPEMAAQRRFAHFPALFLREERRALVIGLGTGTTLGAVAAYPFEHIDMAEISPAIIDAAATHFAEPSRNSLFDERVTKHLNDGRNVLMLADEPYDLITIELTSVWFAGASNLYSKEFYALAKSKLGEGGVLQQWVQLHHIRPRELVAIIRTMLDSFAHVALFEGGAQGILVASDAPLIASRARLARLDRAPAIRETLEGQPLEWLLDELIASDAELHALADDVERENGERIVSTDDNLFLEYATPKGNVMEYHASLAATRALLEAHRTPNPRARHLGP